MQSAILEKIEKESKKTIDGEPEVLYILAEIRKYIEEYEPSNKNYYSNLYFFCNWTLHVTLTYPPTKRYLKKLEDKLDGLESKSFKEIAKDFINTNGSFYLLVDLRRELGIFLDSHSLPNIVTEDDTSWYRFAFYLLEILKDCPLINEDGKLFKFSFEESEGQICFRLKIKNKKGSVKVLLKKETKKMREALKFLT